MRKMILVVASTLTMAVSATLAFADDNSAAAEAKADVKEAASDTKKGANKLGRKVQDKTCEMVNGKMECAGKKIKNAVKNAGDEVHDATH